MKHILLASLMLLTLSQESTPLSGAQPEPILLKIDNLKALAGRPIRLLGDPKVIPTDSGPAVQFDGSKDALRLDSNPLSGLSQFTIEIVFRPDAGGEPEQRFLHFQQSADHRVLIETRLTEDGHWFLDTFMKAGESERTLFAKTHLHSLGEWHHAALTYDGRIMRHYVDGALELEGEVKFVPMVSGETSIGSRINDVYWFKGAIRTIRVSPSVIEPADFIAP